MHPFEGYAKLCGQDVEYYLQKLNVSLGRTRVPDPQVIDPKSWAEEQTVDSNQSLHSTLSAGHLQPSIETLQRVLWEQDVDIPLGTNKNISRLHAKIIYNTSTKFFELHVISKNGVKVNGIYYPPQPHSQPIPLHNGYELQLGDCFLTFMLPIKKITQSEMYQLVNLKKRDLQNADKDRPDISSLIDQERNNDMMMTDESHTSSMNDEVSDALSKNFLRDIESIDDPNGECGSFFLNEGKKNIFFRNLGNGLAGGTPPLSSEQANVLARSLTTSIGPSLTAAVTQTLSGIYLENQSDFIKSFLSKSNAPSPHTTMVLDYLYNSPDNYNAESPEAVSMLARLMTDMDNNVNCLGSNFSNMSKNTKQLLHIVLNAALATEQQELVSLLFQAKQENEITIRNGVSTFMHEWTEKRRKQQQEDMEAAVNTSATTPLVEEQDLPTTTRSNSIFSSQLELPSIDQAPPLDANNTTIPSSLPPVPAATTQQTNTQLTDVPQSQNTTADDLDALDEFDELMALVSAPMDQNSAQWRLLDQTTTLTAGATTAASTVSTATTATLPESTSTNTTVPTPDKKKKKKKKEEKETTKKSEKKEKESKKKDDKKKEKEDKKDDKKKKKKKEEPSTPKDSIKSEEVSKDPNFKKPDISYSTMIAHALMSANNHMLPLKSIYAWISTTYPFYDLAETGWKSSVRHNLSTNSKYFRRVTPEEWRQLTGEEKKSKSKKQGTDKKMAFSVYALVSEHSDEVLGTKKAKVDKKSSTSVSTPSATQPISSSASSSGAAATTTVIPPSNPVIVPPATTTALSTSTNGTTDQQTTSEGKKKKSSSSATKKRSRKKSESTDMENDGLLNFDEIGPSMTLDKPEKKKKKKSTKKSETPTAISTPAETSTPVTNNNPIVTTPQLSHSSSTQNFQHNTPTNPLTLQNIMQTQPQQLAPKQSFSLPNQLPNQLPPNQIPNQLPNQIPNQISNQIPRQSSNNLLDMFVQNGMLTQQEPSFLKILLDGSNGDPTMTALMGGQNMNANQGGMNSSLNTMVDQSPQNKPQIGLIDLLSMVTAMPQQSNMPQTQMHNNFLDPNNQRLVQQGRPNWPQSSMPNQLTQGRPSMGSVVGIQNPAQFSTQNQNINNPMSHSGFNQFPYQMMNYSQPLLHFDPSSILQQGNGIPPNNNNNK